MSYYASACDERDKIATFVAAVANFAGDSAVIRTTEFVAEFHPLGIASFIIPERGYRRARARGNGGKSAARIKGPIIIRSLVGAFVRENTRNARVRRVRRVTIYVDEDRAGDREDVFLSGLLKICYSSRMSARTCSSARIHTRMCAERILNRLTGALTPRSTVHFSRQ